MGASVYAVGVDWAGEKHDVCVLGQDGRTILERTFDETVDGFSEFGRLLDEWSQQGVQLVACIEKPEGLIVDLLVDHSVRVYPINPKSLKRAREVHRASGARDDRFDAFVLADFIRTHHQTLRAIEPNSPEMAELKILTRDRHQQVRHRSRLLTQLRNDLKAFYPRPLEAFDDLKTPVFRDFLKLCQTPQDLEKLTRTKWLRFAKRHRLSKARTDELWRQLKTPQLAVPEHLTRAKAVSVQALMRQLEVVLDAVEDYRKAIELFFDGLPVAEVARSLPGGQSGVTVPSLWAELGDGKRRWESFRHLQATAGSVPITDNTGKTKQHAAFFRFACNKRLRYYADWLAYFSLSQSEWAKDYYDQQKTRGKTHRRALRALAAKWLKIIFVMWRDQVPYDENLHLANIYRQTKKLQVST
jgi:transposase